MQQPCAQTIVGRAGTRLVKRRQLLPRPVGVLVTASSPTDLPLRQLGLLFGIPASAVAGPSTRRARRRSDEDMEDPS